MTWLSVLSVLINLFGPLLVEWLRELLEDTAREMPGRPASSPGAFLDADLESLFDKARSKVWWFQFRKRSAVALAKRAAMRRAAQIHAAAMGRPIVMTPLTADERAELAAELS